MTLIRVAAVLLLLAPLHASALQPPPEPSTAQVFPDAGAPSESTQIEQLRQALVRLPLAAGLASILAMRPRRRAMPRRQASVIETQIILAVVGAVVMLVVG